MLSAAPRLAALFVRRPVLAIVVNALVLVAGLAALSGIEVRELPQIDRPVITVSVPYAGAAPEVVDTEITGRIERAAARIAGVQQISGLSRQGSARVTVEFSEETDIDVAAGDLRDAVARIRATLPADIDEPRIVKADAEGEAIVRVSVTADSLSAEDLTSLVDRLVTDRLAAVDGVADIQLFGDRNAVFRVDADQTALAARGLTMTDLSAAVASVAFDAPAGTLSGADQSLVVRADARLVTAAEIEALPLGPATRLGDVARVSYGPDKDGSVLRVNGRTGVGLGVVRAPGSNTIEISRAVHAVVADIAGTLPEGVSIAVTSDDATFINGALTEVEIALVIGGAIVVAVIFAFLGSLSATLIPAATIPVSLVGTLAAMWLAGFSLNIITLLALVLATGLVVDDAIVVLENIVRRRALGEGPFAAAVNGTAEVFFAVLATTATLVAVFLPISFLPGTAGALFREFGFVLAISVTISGLTALTLTPMLASRLLARQGGPPGALRRLVDRAGAAAAGLYDRLVGAALAAPLVVVAASLTLALAAALAFQTLQRELTPREDRGVVLLSVSAPQGVSLDYTNRQMDRINDLLMPYVDSGEGEAVFSIAGRGGANSAFVVMTLAPWQARARGQEAIVQEINGRLSALPGVRANAISPNSLGIRGGGQGLRFALLGPDYGSLPGVADRLIAALADRPEVGPVRLDFLQTQAQLTLSLDRDRAQDLGIDISGVGLALQALLDGRQVAEINVDDRAVPVKLVSTAAPVDDPGDLADLFLRTGDGRMVPMSSVATLTEEAIAPSLQREGLQRAVAMSAEIGRGYGLQATLDAVRAVAGETLPPGYRILPLGEAAALEKTSGGLAMTFGFAVLVIFLVLAAQFESFLSALIILATVPFGLAAAVLAILATGGTLNLYSQIGLVLLVGVMAKNGILIVEFADQLRERGLDVRTAIRQACRIRLRPVMMTMISTIVGAVPLVLAFGAGAEARRALGNVLVGGLGVAAVFTLFLTPVAYLALARFVAPRSSASRRLEAELTAGAAVVKASPDAA